MSQPDLRYKFEDLSKLRRAHDPEIINKALKSTVGKVTSKFRTFVSKAVRARYTVPAAVVARHAKVERFFTNETRPFSIIRYVGSKIGLINFASAPRIIRGIDKKGRKYKRRGVSHRTLKNEPRKVVRSEPAFIAVGKNDNKHIFARTTDNRFPLVSLKGPSIPEMVGHNEIIAKADDFLSKEMNPIFDNEVEHFLLKKVGLR